MARKKFYEVNDWYMDSTKAIPKNGYVIKNRDNPSIICSLSPILDEWNKILSKKDLVLSVSELDRFGNEIYEHEINEDTLKDVFSLVRSYAFDTESSVFFHFHDPKHFLNGIKFKKSYVPMTISEMYEASERSNNLSFEILIGSLFKEGDNLKSNRTVLEPLETGDRLDGSEPKHMKRVFSFSSFIGNNTHLNNTYLLPEGINITVDLSLCKRDYKHINLGTYSKDSKVINFDFSNIKIVNNGDSIKHIGMAALREVARSNMMRPYEYYNKDGEEIIGEMASVYSKEKDKVYRSTFKRPKDVTGDVQIWTQFSFKNLLKSPQRNSSKSLLFSENDRNSNAYTNGHLYIRPHSIYENMQSDIENKKTMNEINEQYKKYFGSSLVEQFKTALDNMQFYCNNRENCEKENKAFKENLINQFKPVEKILENKKELSLDKD